MGGMIGQLVAIRHPRKVASLASIMSTTGDRTVGAPTGEAVMALLRPPAASREAAIAASLEGSRVISSPGFPFDVDLMTRRAEAAYDRSYCPDGTARQLGAILGSPDRTEGLHRVTIPFLVIHGEEDPLVTVSGGKATAAAVPGSGCLAAVVAGGRRRSEGTRPAGLRMTMSCPSSTSVRPHHDPRWTGWSKAKPPRRTRRARASGV